MKILKNNIYTGADNRLSLYDIFIPKGSVVHRKLPLVILLHGFKGYKDWGAWDEIAKLFTSQHVVFCKMNFSHNGGTVENPIDFPDLEAFSENNYSKEIFDVQTVIDELLTNKEINTIIDTKNITLIGHSRGGGVAITEGYHHNKITKIVTWAGVSDFEKRFNDAEALAYWKKNKVVFIENSRTKQQMPLKYQFYEDFVKNKNRFDIPSILNKLKKPILVIHAELDETVLKEEALLIKSKVAHAKYFEIKNANHVFNTSHPFDGDLPEEASLLVNETLKFILND